MREWGVVHLELIGRHGERALTDLAAAGRRYDIIYLDPPYHARRDGHPLCEVLLSTVGRAGVLAADGWLLVQHPWGIDPSQRVDGLERAASRRHGTTVLSEYRSTAP
jgi:16S rRNA G966 N2-methylase RsmD